ncbi:Hypothetical predicted protein [Mytilus galloprovincialis]|uniref:DZIP3-like HEPN domain-containing protein n=1 Tax=Mytilus galloprovincialis TaxID=29158 RepID=A0A8B6BXW0_MYTGA|nr:Hypothetical predicted protein [Mytilus galloprovincialis]
MAQRERENFYRISTIIVDQGTESLSAVLDNDLSNTTMSFEDFINRHHHEIYHFCYNRRNTPCCQCAGGRFMQANVMKIMYPGQLDILLDKSGPTMLGHNPNLSGTSQHCCRPAKQSLAIANLDITLLRCLLVNFAKNCQTNSTLMQDVEDLVKYRNTLYGHAQEARCSDSEYTKYKTKVEGVILRIARFCNIENVMRQKLNDASQRPMDETILKKYQNALLEQISHENHIEEKLDDLKQQLIGQDEKLHHRMDTIEGKVNEVGYRTTNIKAHTKALLSEHSDDDTYVITEDIRLCCKILEQYNTLVIFAKAGGGKSKASLQTAMIYKQKMYTPMLFVNNEITTHRDLVNFNDKNIVIVEDLFGKSNINFNEDLHRGVLDVLYACIKSDSCSSKLIITVRGDKKIQESLMEKHKIFEKDVLINIDDIRSRQCNMMIFSKHMDKHGISLCECRRSDSTFILPPVAFERCTSEVIETNNNAIQLCVSLFIDICTGKYEMQIGFPQACHLFCSNKSLTKQGSFYFTHASQSLVNEIMDFKLKGFGSKLVQYQYCVLVYAAIKNSIDVDDIDEKCFENILSYFESHALKKSFLKEAVRTLEATYFTKKSSILDRDQLKRSKFSVKYVLQHNTIKEAILLSYGDDVDVLSFCEFGFLFEYIRPIGFKDPLNDHAVFLFVEYQPLINKLITMLNIDNKTCTNVGIYLKTIALLQRRNDIIQFFFQNIEDNKPKRYACLLNGLTCFGKNADLVKFYPKLCKDIMMHFGLTVFLSFCRPKGWTENSPRFLVIETDFLVKTLTTVIATGKLDENCHESKEHTRDLFIISELAKSRYEVGNYVYENLIEKGFLDVVENVFTNLKQNAQKISSMHVKEFLDGLLDEGKRSSIVSQFKDFFESLLFKYGSFPTILELCIPSSSTVSSPNIIKIDDKFLTGKLSAYLESSLDSDFESKIVPPAVHREEGAYIVYWDHDYFEMKHIDLLVKYCIDHGFRSNNENFVRLFYERLVSDEDENSDDDESVNDDSEGGLDDENNEDEGISNYTKVIFDDYPDDEIEVDENGRIVNINVCLGYVKRVYSECGNFHPFNKPTYSRLVKFLSKFKMSRLVGKVTEFKRMAILQQKFEYLLTSLTLQSDSSDSDDYETYF